MANKISPPMSKAVMMMALYGKSKKGRMGTETQQNITIPNKINPIFLLVFILFYNNK